MAMVKCARCDGELDNMGPMDFQTHDVPIHRGGIEACFESMKAQRDALQKPIEKPKPITKKGN